MGRPSKTVTQIEGHRTKREIAGRKREEEKLLSGKKITASFDVKNDVKAMTEFKRIKKLMSAIHKDDALYSAQINRYCMLRSEELGLQARAGKLTEALDYTKDAAEIVAITKGLADIDRLLYSKRKLMESIEKENCMTVQSALRTIPKQPEKINNPLLSALNED